MQSALVRTCLLSYEALMTTFANTNHAASQVVSGKWRKQHIRGLAVVGYEVSDMTEVRIVVKKGIIFARRS